MHTNTKIRWSLTANHQPTPAFFLLMKTKLVVNEPNSNSLTKTETNTKIKPKTKKKHRPTHFDSEVDF